MNSYLPIVVLVALFALACGLSDEQKDTVKKNHGECLEDTGVDEALVKKMREGDFSTEDEPLQRYVFCMMRKSDLITEEGHFNKDVAMSKLPEDADREKVEKAIDECKDEQGATPHESAWLMVKCYHEKNPDHAVV